MKDVEEYPELAPEYREMVGWIVRVVRKAVVMELMAGNDVGCFSVDQYKIAYQKHIDRMSKKEGITQHEVYWADGWVEMHLRSLGLFVREVRPGLWTCNW